ncbi:unnamed protein product [Caretta caretta]
MPRRSAASCISRQKFALGREKESAAPLRRVLGCCSGAEVTCRDDLHSQDAPPTAAAPHPKCCQSSG